MLTRLKLTPLLMFSLDLEYRLIVVLSVRGKLRLKTQISRTDVDVFHVPLVLTLFLGLCRDPEGDKQNTLACFFLPDIRPNISGFSAENTTHVCDACYQR